MILLTKNHKINEANNAKIMNIWQVRQNVGRFKKIR